MNKQRRHLWADYIYAIQKQMRVQDWVFDLAAQASPDAYADIWIQDSHKYGRIRLDANWENLKPEQQRETVVHELTHPHFNDANELLRHNIFDAYSDREATRLWRDYTTLFETAIANVASVIATHMPLPGDIVHELGPKVKAIKVARTKEKAKA